MREQQHEGCGQYRPLPYLKIVYPLALVGRKKIQLKRGRFTLLLLSFRIMHSWIKIIPTMLQATSTVYLVTFSKSINRRASTIKRNTLASSTSCNRHREDKLFLLFFLHVRVARVQVLRLFWCPHDLLYI